MQELSKIYEDLKKSHEKAIKELKEIKLKMKERVIE